MRRVPAVAVACMLLGACGGEQTEAAEVASAYNVVVEAVGDKDYARACEGLTESTRRDLRKAATIEGTDGCGPTLARVVTTVGVEKRALRAADDADVRLAGASSASVGDVRMVKEGGRWRVEGDIDFVRPLLSGPNPMNRGPDASP